MLPTFLVSILISYINGKCANMKQKFDKILGKLVLSVRESPMVDGQLPLGQTPDSSISGVSAVLSVNG